MHTTLVKPLPICDDAYDVIVLGAGGAGLAAAVFSAIAGLRVLVVERTAYVGGTTAWSAGTAWVPLTHHAKTLGVADDASAVHRYLDTLVGSRTAKSLREKFVAEGAAAVALLEAKSHVRYRPFPLHPDYESDVDGASLKGRALDPLPFDGRLLGPLFALLRPPIPEFTVLGGMMVNREDINHLLALTKSLKSFQYALKILARHAMDRLRYPRGTRLVMGNAHVARLLHSLSQHTNTTLCLNAEATQLHRDDDSGRVTGVTLSQNGATKTLTARRGVVLATGGFNRNPERRKALLNNVDDKWCPAAPGHTGSAHTLAEQVGARYGDNALSPAFWAPVSLRSRVDGSAAAFPHFVMDRAKPGFVVVNASGERFLNESMSYHRFGLAMQAAAAVPAFLICDHAALVKYGVGMVRPGGKGLQPFIADGYLTQAATIDALAGALDIPAQLLQSTIAAINASAQNGRDEAFHRGETAYQRNLGDASAGTVNPCLGEIKTGPFYAVRLYPGDIGAALGFATNEHAQALDKKNVPIAGLYAVGNDMHSCMGGVYPAPGITIGPGLVFAFLAVKHLR